MEKSNKSDSIGGIIIIVIELARFILKAFEGERSGDQIFMNEFFSRSKKVVFIAQTFSLP